MELHSFKKKDIDQFARWLQKPHITPWFADAQEWLDEVRQHDTNYKWVKAFTIHVEDDKGRDATIGYCQYYPYSEGGETWHGSIPVDGTYSIDYFIGEEAYLGKGYGKLAVLQLASMILHTGKAQRIIAQPEKENIASQKTLLAAGFKYDESNELYIMDKNGMHDAASLVTESANGSALSIGISLGMCFGVALGSVFGNIALGLGIGMCLGVAMGAGLDKRRAAARALKFPFEQTMRVTSPAFAEGGSIPRRHVVKGDDLSPRLDIEGIPEQTVTLAVIMDDNDQPLEGIYNHWSIWNIPPADSIPEGVPAGERLDGLGGAMQGIGYGKHAYKGPNPPGKGSHRYRFHVFALDCALDIPASGGKKELMDAMNGHILGYGCLTGRYA